MSAEGIVRGQLEVPMGSSEGPDLFSGPRDMYRVGRRVVTTGGGWLGHQQNLVSVQMEGIVSVRRLRFPNPRNSFLICQMGIITPTSRLMRMR